MAEVRTCEQCDAVFEPRREHARFCSVGCRIAWDREHAGGRRVAATALDWSLTAMSDVTSRLGRVTARNRQHAFAVISEAVWWVTIVDGTLMRYHPDAYDEVMTSQVSADRERIEGMLAGLRFVRNRMGYHTDHADFIGLRRASADPRGARFTAWEWKSQPEPDVGMLSPRGQAWEMTRYQAYQDHLAGRAVTETFHQTSAFLNLVSSQASTAEVGNRPTRR